MSPDASAAPEKANDLVKKVRDGGYDDTELQVLLEEEQAGEKRTTVIDAIESEQKRRAAEAQAKAEEAAAEAKAAEVAADEAAKASPDKRPVEEILAEAQNLTGYSQEFVAGAVFDQGDQLSVEEVKRLCEKFADKPVYTETEEEKMAAEKEQGEVSDE